MSRFKYIKVDETKFWSRYLLDKIGEGAKIIATYIFDSEERVFCCEMTPSYYLRYAGTDIIPSSDKEYTEEEWNDIDEIVLEGERQCDNDHYRHCYLLKDAKEVPCEAETIEDAIEEYYCNPW